MDVQREIRIGYDCQGFQQRIGGVSRYFSEMIRRLPKDIQWELPFDKTHNEYLLRAPYSKRRAHLYLEEFLPKWPTPLRGLAHKSYQAFDKVFPNCLPQIEGDNSEPVRKIVDSGRFDLIHFTGPHWLGRGWRGALGKIPYVVTVHDFIPEIFGGQEGAVAERAEVVENAAHVIAVSECTKEDLIRLYGTPSEKISVVHHGWAEDDLSAGRVVGGIGPGRFILFVGTRDGCKNWEFLVRALADLLVSRDMSLVCTGNGLTSSEAALVTELGISNRVRCMSFADDEMSWLYANAHCFIYPSKYEGFGIPILEAFSRRCPVVLSRSSCFPEVAADAALYFDEGDAEQLRKHVETLLDERIRARLVARGTERCKAFSWERCAQETATVYRHVLDCENQKGGANEKD